MVNDQLQKLKQSILSKFPEASFERGVDTAEMNRFEGEHKIKLPERLKAFYSWHNGITINDKQHILSLQEAYSTFIQTIPQLYVYNEGSYLTHKIKDIEKYSSNPAEELEQLLSQPKHQIPLPHRETTGFWLPFFVFRYAGILQMYALSLAKANQDHSNDRYTPVKFSPIHLKEYQADFEYFSTNTTTLLITDSMDTVLQVVEKTVYPHEKGFWQELKSFFRSIGSLLDSF